MRSNYGIQLSGLQERTSDLICRDDGSHSPAAEASANVWQNDEFVSERLSSFLTELSGVLRRLWRQRNRQISSVLYKCLSDISSEINGSMQYIEGLAGCEGIYS